MKYYELKKGDKADHGGEILTFQKIDGMYAHWNDEEGNIEIGHSYEYELKDGIYYPVPSNL